MGIDVAAFRAFLNRPGVEGPQRLVAYVPCRPRNYTGQGEPSAYAAIAASGVTVATGCDLGQQSGTGLRAMGVDADILRRLAPYLQKRRAAALAALHERPLALRREEADAIDAVVIGRYALLAAARYDRDAGDGAFAALPWQAQAAIGSILFQRGSGSPRSYPNTWAAFVARDWKTAAAKLCNASLWDAYRIRRRLEGELLKELA